MIRSNGEPEAHGPSPDSAGNENRPLWQRVSPNFKAAFRAIEDVEKRLQAFTTALDAAGIEYAIIGGNAVAAWVSTVDPDAVRSTKDVDVLLQLILEPRKFFLKS